MIIILFCLLSLSIAQGATRYKWVVVGSLHSFYYDTGNEVEVAVNSSEQIWGFAWDAFYRHKDMQAARGMWIGAADFYDPVMERIYDYKVAHNGPRAVPDIEMREYMPQEIKQIARYPHPEVYVDGNDGSDMMNAADAKNDDIDEIDPSIPADRIVFMRVNTSLGLTMKRTIYVLSQQNYDNFHVHEYEFENTGIYNVAGDVYEQTLKDVYFHWLWRDAICLQGSWEGTYLSTRRNWIQNSVRDIRWGYATMNDAIGTDQNNPLLVSPRLDRTGQDAMDDRGGWMRGYMSWLGYWSDFGYDNVGSPLVTGVAHHGFSVLNDGRLGSPQYKGMVVIHADKSTTDPSDNPDQPSSSGFINHNNPHTYASGLNQYDANFMRQKYLTHIAGGHKGNHAETVWQSHGSADGLMADAGGYTKANEASGFSQMLGFGPYTIAPGEKIRIVFAECAAGLPHQYGYEVGQLWHRAKYKGQTPDVIDPRNPSGTITINADNANEWKDLMVYSGRDSMMNTFRNAINVYETNFYEGVPEAPHPPEIVEVFSTEDGIRIKWKAASAITFPGFEGFRIYRAFVEKDSTYRVALDCNINSANLDDYRIAGTSDEFEFLDVQPLRGQNYYYYITSYDDGSQNLMKPGVALESSPFYTRTNRAATVKSPPAPNEKLNLDDYDLNNPADRKALMHLLVKIVPNPINVRNEKIQFRGNVNKLLFAGVPTGCRIKVFTERGDFVADIEQSEEGYAWYLTTEWQQILVSGVYIAYFEMYDDFEDEKTGVRFKEGDSIVKKFIVIR
ncbi:MAG: hypothetical protein K0B52_01440 [FCB group bacterium]|nr:hypothetical protein [FCB group bacterium]